MFVTQVSGSPFPEPDSGAPGCHPATGNHIDKGATHPWGSSDLRAGTAPVPPQSTAEPGLRRGLCVHLNPPVCPGPDTLSRSPRQALRPPRGRTGYLSARLPHGLPSGPGREPAGLRMTFPTVTASGTSSRRAVLLCRTTTGTQKGGCHSKHFRQKNRPSCTHPTLPPHVSRGPSVSFLQKFEKVESGHLKEQEHHRQNGSGRMTLRNG